MNKNWMKNHFQQHQEREKRRKFQFTRPLQLIHLLFGGSFIRPLIILSFRSSSFLLPIATKAKKDLGFLQTNSRRRKKIEQILNGKQLRRRRIQENKKNIGSYSNQHKNEEESTSVSWKSILMIAALIDYQNE